MVIGVVSGTTASGTEVLDDDEFWSLGLLDELPPLVMSTLGPPSAGLLEPVEVATFGESAVVDDVVGVV